MQSVNRDAGHRPSPALHEAPGQVEAQASRGDHHGHGAREKHEVLDGDGQKRVEVSEEEFLGGARAPAHDDAWRRATRPLKSAHRAAPRGMRPRSAGGCQWRRVRRAGSRPGRGEVPLRDRALDQGAYRAMYSATRTLRAVFSEDM